MFMSATSLCHLRVTSGHHEVTKGETLAVQSRNIVKINRSLLL